jgi:hypothetical protein
MLGDRLQCRLRVEAARHHDAVTQRQAEGAGRQPGGVEQGSGDAVGAVARQGNPVEYLGRLQRVDLVARCALWCSGGTAGQQYHPARVRRGRQRRRRPALDHLIVLVSDDPHGVRRQDIEKFAEFVVGENAADLFSRSDVRQLRAGEATVHQDQSNAEFVRCAHRRHEVPAVAVQCGDHRAGPNSPGRQRTGQRVGILVEFAEAERPAFVGDRRRIAVAGGGVVDESAERAVAPHGKECPYRLVGPQQIHDAAVLQDPGCGQTVAQRGQTGQVHDATLASATAVRKKCPATCRLVSPPSRGQSQ